MDGRYLDGGTGADGTDGTDRVLKTGAAGAAGAGAAGTAGAGAAPGTGAAAAWRRPRSQRASDTPTANANTRAYPRRLIVLMLTVTPGTGLVTVRYLTIAKPSHSTRPSMATSITRSIVYQGNGGVVTARATPVISSAPRHGRSGSPRRSTNRAVTARMTNAAPMAHFPGSSAPSSRNRVPSEYPSCCR